jgi:hypothetical protein
VERTISEASSVLMSNSFLHGASCINGRGSDDQVIMVEVKKMPLQQLTIHVTICFVTTLGRYD